MLELLVIVDVDEFPLPAVVVGGRGRRGRRCGRVGVRVDHHVRAVRIAGIVAGAFTACHSERTKCQNACKSDYFFHNKLFLLSSQSLVLPYRRRTPVGIRRSSNLEDFWNNRQYNYGIVLSQLQKRRQIDFRGEILTCRDRFTVKIDVDPMFKIN